MRATPPYWLQLSDEVAAALAEGRGVVALESTLITHGLPAPRNLEAARRAEAAVRGAGSVPATVALHDGRVRVGLSAEELDQLAAAAGSVPKVSRRDLAAGLGQGGWAGTTVSATMLAAHAATIRIFATGGIGGVHRGGERTLDISADLDELARTPVAVVCAGPKSILDARLTMEVLETRGVPVVGWRTDELPGFYARTSGLKVPWRVDSADEAAGLIGRQLDLGLGNGIVIAVPVPEGNAIPRDEMDRAIDEAIADAELADIHGSVSTPWILGRVAQLTRGRSIEANIALIEENARVAGSIAAALARLLAA